MGADPHPVGRRVGGDGVEEGFPWAGGAPWGGDVVKGGLITNADGGRGGWRVVVQEGKGGPEGEEFGEEGGAGGEGGCEEEGVGPGSVGEDTCIA